jgi:hypothetical protein
VPRAQGGLRNNGLLRGASGRIGMEAHSQTSAAPPHRQKGLRHADKGRSRRISQQGHDKCAAPRELRRQQTRPATERALCWMPI